MESKALKSVFPEALPSFLSILHPLNHGIYVKDTFINIIEKY